MTIPFAIFTSLKAEKYKDKANLERSDIYKLQQISKLNPDANVSLANNDAELTHQIKEGMETIKSEIHTLKERFTPEIEAKSAHHPTRGRGR